jgi:hypothetical protein
VGSPTTEDIGDDYVLVFTCDGLASGCPYLDKPRNIK